MPSPLLLALALALPTQASDEAPKPPEDRFRPDPGWKELGKSLWFDPKQRRLIVRARVALTEGALEHLLCREQTKEHESILASEAEPRRMHAGLLLTGAEPGHPVRFQPKFEPPTGTPIRIELEWTEGGKARRADAKEWVKDLKTGKSLDVDWVFGGSHLFQDPETKKMIYSADGGDVITVSNFVSAMLDLPMASSASDEAREFVANSAKIPPRGTPVTMILRPAVTKPAAPPPASPAPRPAPGR
jgi:hypothetical protein